MAHCPDYDPANAPAKWPVIWRGFGSSDMAYHTLTAKTRRSKNVETGIYNVLADAALMPRGYPSRHEAFICTTSPVVAKMYGHIYLVIPKAGASIGVCPADDIWYTRLPGMPYINELPTLNEVVFNIAKAVNPKSKSEHTHNEAELRRLLLPVDEAAAAYEWSHEAFVDAYDLDEIDMSLITQWFAERGSLFDWLCRKFEHAGFEHALFGANGPVREWSGGYNRPGDTSALGNEVWVGGDCLFISADRLGEASLGCKALEAPAAIYAKVSTTSGVTTSKQLYRTDADQHTRLPLRTGGRV